MKYPETENSKLSPINKINDRLYLNDVSIKYRYEQMKLKNIAESLSPGITSKNGNLFNRLVHIGHNFDIDISTARKNLHDLNNKRRAERKLRDYEHPHIKFKSSIFKTSADYFSTGIRSRIPNNRLKNVTSLDSELPILSISSETEETEVNCKEETKNQEVIQLKKKASIRLQKEISVKLVKHKKKFSMFFKTNSQNISRTNSPKRNNKFSHHQKSSDQRRTIIFSDNDNSQNDALYPHFDEGEYEKIDNGKSIQLFKKYLFLPKQELSSRKHMKHLSVNGRTSLDKLFPVIEDRSQSKQLASNENTNRSLSKNEIKEKHMKRKYLDAKKSQKTNSQLPEIGRRQLEIDKLKLKSLKEKNEEALLGYRKLADKKLYQIVDISKEAIERIHQQMTDILSTACKEFESRIEKSTKKKVK